MFKNPRPFSGNPSPLPAVPRKPFGRLTLTKRRLFYLACLSILLLSGVIGGWSAANVIFHSKAANPPPSMTVQQFLHQGTPYQAFVGPHVLPNGSQALPFWTLPKLPPATLPSAEPPTMTTVSQTLASTASTPTTGSATPTHLVGSDAQGRRLEVLIPAGALNLTGATTTAGGAPQGALTLTLSELHGHYATATNELGAYQVRLTDAGQHVLQGVQLRSPITFIFHYRPGELQALDLDPGKVFLIWTDRIAAQLATKQPLTGDVIPMQNDSSNNTLTAQSSVIAAGTLTVAGTPENESPPTPHMASVSGNGGQLSYSYPLVVAPGPDGTVPDLAVSYSSADTNGRHAANSPAPAVGEGWSLTLGAVTADKHPNGEVWYSISGVDHISDRLIPDSSGTNFTTQHLSYLKITQVTVNGQPCFHVWDPSGTYYEFGCTPDSLEYYIDASNTRTNYAWNLDKVMPANEGPGTNGRSMSISYVQDIEQINGQNSVRDSAIKQIVYGNGQSTAGTVDFFYDGPTATSPWVTAYGTNEGGCTPPDGLSTTQRCDDPLNKSGGLPDPTVMSTLTLETVKTYVGDDSSTSHLDYSYSFSYQDSAFYDCTDPATLSPEYCAGNHLLTSITPTVYQNGTGHQLPAITFTYTGGRSNSYTDTTQTVGGSAFKASTTWQYLASYHDHSDGVGATIQYHTAWNNSNGTPITSNGDNRYDALFCDWNPSDCQQSPFAPTNQKMWTEQVVTAITSTGKDSSSSSLAPATTSYDYWLTKTEGTCAADSSGDTDCVGFGYIPNDNSGWADYYDGEFTGFGTVLITSPSGDLTVQKYASTEGWQSPPTDAGNYTAGQLYEEDVYAGQSINGSRLIEQTQYTYAGTNGTHTSCSSTFSTASYTACEVIPLTTKTTIYEQTGSNNSNAPWTQTSDTYDDYNSSSGLGDFHQAPATGSYHNLQQEVITSSNAPTETHQWTYYTTNTTINNWVYYNVDQVAHSDTVDATNHTWQCEDITYDEGAASGVPTPSAGWATTVTSYSTCSNPSGSAIKDLTGYDVNGNVVATVDGLGVANPGLYSNAGCTLSTSPTYFPASSWSNSSYTSCSTYDSTSGLPTGTWNALNQHTSVSYDATQGMLAVSATDANGQTTTTAYSYDSNGDKTVSTTAPGESNSFTSQSTLTSHCTDSSTLPCFEVDSVTSQYSGAVTRTFYDSLGREVETLTPGPDGSHTTVVFILYNDQTHAVFKSEPFVVASRSTWLDPNGATDDQGNVPGGTATTLDPLGRTLTVTDPAGHVTTASYGLATSGVSGDPNTYATITDVDANHHVQVHYGDVLGRTIYVVDDSGVSGGTLTPVRRVSYQYNVLNDLTAVTVTDLAPQSGQTITSVTTTATYDDLGRITTLHDPDRGSYTYSYDADGRLISLVSGTRTLGYSYDLLGRLGCLQNAVPTADPHGACSSGASPYVQNTYDADPSGVTWNGTNYAVGFLTQSVAYNNLPSPDNTQGIVTENMQYDQRGRLITERMQITTSGGSLAFPTFPLYQESNVYNDANQLMTTQTTVGGQPGYTESYAYDSTTGVLTGLSNTTTGAPTLASLSYNAQGQISAITFNDSTNSPLASEQITYDADLRPLSTTTTWQNGGGTISSDALTYDAVGNVTSRTTTQAAVPGVANSGGTEVQNFCYNEQNELVWASNASVPTPATGQTCGSTATQGTLGNAYTASYVYTHLGQLWQGPLGGNGTQEQYLYCGTGPHQLTDLAPVSSSPTCSNPGNTDYSSQYDAWGNLSTRGSAAGSGTFTFDAQNRLLRWNGTTETSSQEAWYFYDASGHRVMLRTASTRSGGNPATAAATITTYAFGLEDHQYQYSGSGSSMTNSSNDYYYSLDGTLIGMLTGSSTLQTQFLLTDSLGSVVAAISNTAGSAQVLGNQLYGPYGNLRYTAGTIGTTRGFTGQYTDALTGLDYYGARSYDPLVGRFISADEVEGNLQAADPYAYVNGNPETDTDPTGEFIYDPVTGQAAIPSPTPGVAPTVVQWNAPVAYLPPPPPVRPKTPASVKPAHKTAAHAPGGKAALHTVLTVVKAAATVADFVFNFSGMATDVQTIFSSKTSTWQKIGAAADLGFNLWMDVNMFDGEGEALRAVDLAARGAEDLVSHGAEDVGTHVLEDAVGCGTGLSFRATTLVTVAHGSQAIGTIRPGEKVLAYNPKTHRMELEPVVRVWINHDSDLVDLTVTSSTHAPHSTVVHKHSEVIHTNQRHPFLTLEHGFVPVSQLTLGMQVLNADGTVGTVTGWKVVPGTQVMYHLDVAQDHTYTVGAGQWMVHNCGSTIEEVWHEGSFNSSAESAQYHFNKHDTEVGATSLEQYINKAKGFLQDRR
jgi:RHS repeat-associated protein